MCMHSYAMRNGQLPVGPLSKSAAVLVNMHLQSLSGQAGQGSVCMYVCMSVDGKRASSSSPDLVSLFCKTQRDLTRMLLHNVRLGIIN